MKKNKLSNMELDSVDLCKMGANQRAKIKLYKSAPGGENDMEHITKSMGTAQVQETTYALCKSLESIIAGDSLDAVEKQQMMEESLQQVTDEATGLMGDWAEAIGKADDEDEDTLENEPEDDSDDEPEDEPEDDDRGEEDEPEDDVGKGGSGCAPKVRKAAKGEVFDMATIDISKMSLEDKITLEALAKKYGDNGENEEPVIHPDVKKALEEVAEMRKSMELEKLEGVAKKYEIIGKKAPELAQKLYDLKQAGEQHYNDYVALLDEQVAMANSGIYKEYGSNRSASDLNSTVAEVMKANPGMTREQAVVRAFENNPALDPFTGRVK